MSEMNMTSYDEDFYKIHKYDKISSYAGIVFFVIHILSLLVGVAYGSYGIYAVLLMLNITIFPMGYMFIAILRNTIKQNMRIILLHRKLSKVAKKIGDLK